MLLMWSELCLLHVKHRIDFVHRCIIIQSPTHLDCDYSFTTFTGVTVQFKERVSATSGEPIIIFTLPRGNISTDNKRPTQSL